MKKTLLISAALVIVCVLVVASCQTSRAGYESAPYKIVLSRGEFELRDYPAITVVETAMAGENGEGSFGRLFGFLSGRNADQKKIAMTTPVFMAEGEAGRTMAFVLPADLKAGAVPKPADGSLVVRDVPAGRFAVLRFSGNRGHQRETENLEKLNSWMVQQAVRSSVAPVYGYFDPPWTPSFLRRNEVMLRLD